MGLSWGDDMILPDPKARIEREFMSQPIGTVQRLAIDVADAVTTAPQTRLRGALADLDAATLRRLLEGLTGRSRTTQVGDS